MDLSLVFSQLIRIDGLDIWDGLVHVGCSQEVYAEALRIFCRDLENKYNKLREFSQNENWKDYAAAVHAIKGGLAGIGAWKLSGTVKELEDAVLKDNFEFCREKTHVVITNIEQFTGALKSTVLFELEEIVMEQVPLTYMEKKLGEMYMYCSFGNSEEADALARELKTKTSGEEIDSIVDTVCTHVENLDYHLVLQLLAKQPYIKDSLNT